MCILVSVCSQILCVGRQSEHSGHLGDEGQTYAHTVCAALVLAYRHTFDELGQNEN